MQARPCRRAVRRTASDTLRAGRASTWRGPRGRKCSHGLTQGRHGLRPRRASCVPCRRSLTAPPCRRRVACASPCTLSSARTWPRDA